MSIGIFIRGVAIGALLLAAAIAIIYAVLFAVMHLEWALALIVALGFGSFGIEIAKSRNGGGA